MGKKVVIWIWGMIHAKRSGVLVVLTLLIALSALTTSSIAKAIPLRIAIDLTGGRQDIVLPVDDKNPSFSFRNKTGQPFHDFECEVKKDGIKFTGADVSATGAQFNFDVDDNRNGKLEDSEKDNKQYSNKKMRLQNRNIPRTDIQPDAVFAIDFHFDEAPKNGDTITIAPSNKSGNIIYCCVPSLSEWGIIALGALLAFSLAWMITRKQLGNISA